MTGTEQELQAALGSTASPISVSDVEQHTAAVMATTCVVSSATSWSYELQAIRTAEVATETQPEWVDAAHHDASVARHAAGNLGSDSASCEDVLRDEHGAELIEASGSCGDGFFCSAAGAPASPAGPNGVLLFALTMLGLAVARQQKPSSRAAWPVTQKEQVLQLSSRRRAGAVRAAQRLAPTSRTSQPFAIR